MDELDEVEEKEKQIEKERATEVVAANPSDNPFAGLDVPLLPPKVWADWDFAYENPQVS
jgi:hypothetical protein